MSQPVELTTDYTRANTPVAFRYSDWRTKTGLDDWGLEAINERMIASLESLKADGNWRCFEQLELEVRPDMKARLVVHHSNADNLVVAFCPDYPEELAFRVKGGSDTEIHATGDYNYPVISFFRQQYKSASEIIFYFRPLSPTLMAPERRTRITIFVLDRAPISRGPGCDLKSLGLTVTRHPKVWEKGFNKILWALGAEAGRRLSQESEAVGSQLIFTGLRDLEVKEALVDMFPGATKEDIGYMARALSLLIAEDFNPTAGAVVREAAREHAVQYLNGEYPRFSLVTEFADLLLDVYLQRKDKP